MNSPIETAQVAICAKFSAIPHPPHQDMKVGISKNVRDGALPLNGLRHAPNGDAAGWYIWAGDELSQEEDFFVPLHIEHLETWCPQVIPYLALPAGWRFLLAPDYEDVWFDASIIHA